MDRRTFVKSTLAAGAAAALASAGCTTKEVTVGVDGVARYFGARMVSGPAWRGVPYIPITIENGHFVGKPNLTIRGERVDILHWYEYCGHGDAPGLDPSFGSSNVLTFRDKDDYRIITPWFADKIGQPMRPDDFPDVGFGAPFVWRSEGETDPARMLTGVIVRVGAGAAKHIAAPTAPAQGLSQQEFELVTRDIFHGEFIAMCDVCTHFCCHAGYKEAEKLAKPRNAWENLFCTCHSAAFDFLEPVAYGFPADIPRPDRGSGGDVATVSTTPPPH